MSTTVLSAPVTAKVAVDPATLHIVLFGMPDAGKSSLLGALIQSSHTQDRILQGRLIDLTNGMTELWRRVYESRQRETLDEIVPYPITFEPYAPTKGSSFCTNIVLYDCDGRAANAILSQRKSLQDDVRDGSLAQAVIGADALILPIDASAKDEQIETDFREFARFLQVIEAHRSHKHDVGGLPVFLVLTKCDLLAIDTCSRADWDAAIDIRKKQVAQRFASYLESNSKEALPSFGSIELRVAPTAVKRPELADAVAFPREPLGVAEVFRDCLRSANAYRQAEISADRRLRWALMGGGGFLAFALTTVIGLFVAGGPIQRPVGLIDKVEQFQLRDKPLPDRLANDLLQRRKTELDELRSDADFDRLPEDKRDFVRGRIDELQSYLRYREQLALVASPNRARSLADLDLIREQLETQGAVPDKFGVAWNRTPAVIERHRHLQECQAIRKAVDEDLRSFFVGLKNKGTDLLFAKEVDTRWEDQTNSLFESEKKPPISRDDPAKGVAFDYDEIHAVEKEWLSVRQRLAQVRDLALALGLLGDPHSDSAVLALPATTTGAELAIVAATRIETLKKLYPSYKTWSLIGIPEEIHGEIRKKLKRSLDQLTRDGQRMILDKYKQFLTKGEDTIAVWSQIGPWLLRPEFQKLRELAGLLTVLLDPSAAEPFGTAAQFLLRKSFDIQVKSITLTIPNNLPQGQFVPGEVLQIHWRTQGANAAQTTLSFRIDKLAPVEGARVKKYRFLLENGDGRFTFKPGDEFSAELPLTKDDKPWQLTWMRRRTSSYAFESLEREPIIYPAGQADRGVPADGVAVIVEGKFPATPALIPDVKHDLK